MIILLMLILSIAMMYFTGWLWGIDYIGTGVAVMFVWILLAGFFLKELGATILACLVIFYLIGGVIIGVVINEQIFESEGEVHTVAYVSNRNYWHTTINHGNRIRSNQKKVTRFVADIAYPTYGIAEDDFIYHNFDKNEDGHLRNPEHILSEKVILSFAIARPELYNILIAHPTEEELAQYESPKVLVSDSILLEGSDAKEYMEKYVKNDFNPDAEPVFAQREKIAYEVAEEEEETEVDWTSLWILGLICLLLGGLWTYFNIEPFIWGAFLAWVSYIVYIFVNDLDMVWHISLSILLGLAGGLGGMFIGLCIPGNKGSVANDDSPKEAES